MDARKASVENEEYVRIFSRIDELEKEEEEAEKSNESDENEGIQNEPDSTLSEMSIHQEVRSSPVQVIDVAKASEAPAVSKCGLCKSFGILSAPCGFLDFLLHDSSDPEVSHYLDESSHWIYTPVNSSTMHEVLELPEEKKKVQAPPTTSNMAFTGSIVEHAHNIGMNMLEQRTGARSSKPVSRFKMQRK
ncbi:UNVERIFIED_CONTAM: hypothetical protein Slati_2152500 [Sesamum latifolium]|uniref:Uncharacterized protein n=1 Tax=Sesamum latifolium TaxID=2727402 RepID=A0AAW2WS07_9LAMI